MNSVSLIGRVGQNPELKQTSNNTAFTRFSLATKGNDKDSTMWVKIVAWGKTAEMVVQYVKKGSLIGINGRLDIRQYEKSGEKRTSCEVIADKIDFCESKKATNTEKPQNDSLFC